MSEPHMKRLRAEYKRMKIEYPLGKSPITWKIINRDLHFYEITIPGPKKTPYTNGKFKISIKLPPEYPNKPPIANFITPIYHPNISAKFPEFSAKNAWTYKWGSNICLSLINHNQIGKEGGWNIEVYLCNVVEHLYMMLEVFQTATDIKEFPEYLVNPNSAFNEEAGRNFLNNFKQFIRISKEWTTKYAITSD
ncbi:MAG: ubiquitin-conjugating enzyme E2 variant [Promethearchaeota archaeon]